MNLTKDNVIGIVGGMGPQAGVALLNNIVENTVAHEDQQHLSAVLMSFPKYLVDRTSFLEGKQEVNPAHNIVDVILRLENAGSKIVGIACNTSHSPKIYDVISRELAGKNSRVKLLNMPEEVCRYIHDQHPDVRRIGLMATNGTYKTGVYSNRLERMGYEVVLPDPEFQNEVIHKMIYDKTFGIKACTRQISREALSLLDDALAYFHKHETDAIILGCTELSLILPEEAIHDMIVVDSTKAFAKALIREALVEENHVNEEQKILLTMPDER